MRSSLQEDVDEVREVSRLRHAGEDAAERRRGAGRRDAGAVAGGEQADAAPHVPVMPAEVLRFLEPTPGATLVDGTVGFGGHAAVVLPHLAPGGRLIAIDRDPDAAAAAEVRLRPLAADLGVQLDVVRENFTALPAVLDRLGVPSVAGVLFDFGVSSAQLDRPGRGFSYREDAPLDMRMDPEQRTTAYHLVNGLSEAELTEIIQEFGQERWARRIAAFIVRRRQEHGLISTTGELVEVIKAAVPAGARQGGPHPARRTFMALRIAVNNELGAAEAGLRAAAARLQPGGRLVAIAFHSLEDRIVKNVIRELAAGCTCPPDWPVCRCGAQPTLRPLFARPVRPGEEETAANPRARSARLRVAVRLPAPGSEPEGQRAPAASGTGGRLRPVAGPGAGGLASALSDLLSGQEPSRLGPQGSPSLFQTLKTTHAVPSRRSYSRAGSSGIDPVLRLRGGK